ncbi:MAG: TonB-dependent receptor, partial [Pseudomonadota bacterium]|nr:TonB-dependent receptor [Pseudomonadota bacterium]
MSEAPLNTIEKALALNLDPLKYGTIIEIGAGQEIARWFFQAGGAAGTIAKTMSAYDMHFSDAIYGAESDRRYVSRNRLERMLAQEYDLILSRIKKRRPEGSTFFSFA